MSDDPVLLIERDGPVAILTLNRPKQLNALSFALRRDICAALRTLGADDGVRAVVLTGNGRAFSAGFDLKETRQAEGEPEDTLAQAFAACPWPVIGAVNGFAITGGFELALLCDLIYASTEAKFADTHARIGLLPAWGLSQLLPRRIGAPRAKEMSLAGNFLDAETAERWGLVNRVLAPDELLPAARKLAHDMAQADGALLKKLKALTDDGMALPLKEALALEIARSNAHNSGVPSGAAAANLDKAMERGRGQKG